ncbi:aldehyde ferredoxin oxidoreductase N-terminal domain-containing protein, partial [Staphylococcus aureus]|nr:aldehyde ferredoxin oxidoreductase N-terminal domain-containing protein [Staphylococcus aureus]
NAFTFGIGRLADSPLAGARRLFVCGYSHQWESFYLSSAGGVAYTFKHFGIPWVTLVGRAAQPSVLILRHDGNAATVTLEP